RRGDESWAVVAGQASAAVVRNPQGDLAGRHVDADSGRDRGGRGRRLQRGGGHGADIGAPRSSRRRAETGTGTGHRLRRVHIAPPAADGRSGTSGRAPGVGPGRSYVVGAVRRRRAARGSAGTGRDCGTRVGGKGVDRTAGSLISSS